MAWPAFAELFEANASYFDAIHGWSHGRDAIREFLERTMRGAGPWRFIEDWRVVDGDRVVFHWTQRFVEPKKDGSWWQFEGVSALRYGATGRWAEQRDIYDTAEAAAVLNDWAVSQSDRRREKTALSSRG